MYEFERYNKLTFHIIPPSVVPGNIEQYNAYKKKPDLRYCASMAKRWTSHQHR